MQVITDARRIDLLETETAQSRQRLTAIEELLFRVVETSNSTAQPVVRLVEAYNTTATTVGILTIKIDQIVDALLHPASNGGRAK